MHADIPVDTGDRRTWASGDYARIGNLWLLVSELLCESADIRAGERVLDVATGSGNTALAARRRFAVVTAVDYVPALLDHARARAAADGLDVTFEAGDAQRLSYADGSFDVALSTFGIMYVPDQRSTARELVRVVRPGGRIAVAGWTPEGWLGRLLHLIAAHTAPSAPSSDTPPAATLWGTEKHVRELFGDHVSALTAQTRNWSFRFPSATAFIEYFRADFGPLNRAFAVLDAERRRALWADLIDLIAEENTAIDGTVVVPSSYLEVIATRSTR